MFHIPTRSAMADQHVAAAPVRRGGNYCVAGLPNKMSCKNSTYVEGISMHRFPKNEERRRKWTRFVQRHRPDFVATTASYLCSAHFLPTCFTKRQDIIVAEEGEASPSFLRLLDRGAIPTEDGVAQPVPVPSARERRNVRRSVFLEIPEENAAETEMETEEDETPVPCSSLSCERCPDLLAKLRRYQKEASRQRLAKESVEEKLAMVISNKRSNNIERDSSAQEVYHDQHNVSFECSEEEPSSEVDLDESMYEEEELEEETPPEALRIDSETSPQDEPKFVVFQSMLIQLFSLFCFNCQYPSPPLKLWKTGTMVTIVQNCQHCEKEFRWNSQPFVLGRHPAGNLLLSFATLAAGSSISKIIMVFKHMGLSVYDARTFFSHQKKFLIPNILHNWSIYQSNLFNELKSLSIDLSWSGDGRFDSMGHCAKYGSYTMFCSSVMKIVHFQLLQANEVGSSTGMELEGAKRSLAALFENKIDVSTFVSDRHLGIRKWLREEHAAVAHYFDIWHVARSVVKKIGKAAIKKDCSILNSWLKSIKRHLYWCATSTKEGYGDLVVAKWQSLVRHIADQHDGHGSELFPQCVHGELEPRDWIKIGTKAYDELQLIFSDKRLLNDIRQISCDAQTSFVEAYHATLNHWHPKMTCFSYLGSKCRMILAILHFNENLKRETRKTRQGDDYLHVTYPKFKSGEENLRRVAVPATYEYVKNIRDSLFAATQAELKEMMNKFADTAPQSLTSQFVDRLSKEEAILKHKSRMSTPPVPYPSPEVQATMQTAAEAVCDDRISLAQKCSRKCRKCGQPMKGHLRGRCENEGINN